VLNSNPKKSASTENKFFFVEVGDDEEEEEKEAQPKSLPQVPAEVASGTNRFVYWTSPSRTFSFLLPLQQNSPSLLTLLSG
jgi:hypothetical protein